MNPTPGVSPGTSILLTGGAGFIGSHLAERLLGAGAHVTILDNLNDAYATHLKQENLRQVSEQGSFDFLQVDIANPEQLQSALSGKSYDAVIHLAARTGVRSSLTQPLLYGEVNLQGTLGLLELARRGMCRQFIFGSSSSVYGKTSRAPFSEEESRLDPLSPYGVTKLAGEKLCQCFARLYGLEVICLRFFSVYGPRQRPDLAMHKFARAIEENRPVTLFGDGSSLRDYSYVDDIVDGIAAALALKVGFEVFNLGSGNPIPLKRMVRLLERALGKPALLRMQADQAADMPVTHADLEKAARVLGYAPKVPFEEGLARFTAWFRKTSRRAGLPETNEKRQKEKSDPRRHTKDLEGPLRR